VKLESLTPRHMYMRESLTLDMCVMCAHKESLGLRICACMKSLTLRMCSCMKSRIFDSRHVRTHAKFGIFDSSYVLMYEVSNL
jgi:hypothetical protein